MKHLLKEYLSMALAIASCMVVVAGCIVMLFGFHFHDNNIAGIGGVLLFSSFAIGLLSVMVDDFFE